MPTKNSNKQKGGHCHFHVNKLRSVLVGASKVPQKTTQKGGNNSSTKPIGVTPYQKYNNGGSDRQAAMEATKDANAAQQKAIEHSHVGGKQKKKNNKTKKVKKNRKYKRRKTKKTKHIKKSRKHKKKNHKKKTRKVKRRPRYKKKGGSSICGSQGTVVVPSFKTGGKPVGPVTADTMSQGGNSSNLNAGCQAANDCYATNSCGKVGGSSKKNEFFNEYQAFPIGSFGSSMTGPNQKGGYMKDRTDFIEYSSRD